jgi:hypothetical protein
MQTQTHLNTDVSTRIDPLMRTNTLIRKTPARFKGLKDMIGNTPLLAIRFSFRGIVRVIYAKAEYLN